MRLPFRASDMARHAPARASRAIRHGQRVLLRPADPHYRVLSRQLLLLVLACAVLTALVSRFDGMLLQYVRANPDHGLIAGMHAVTDIGLSQWYIVPAALVLLFVVLSDWRSLGFRGRARRLTIAAHAAFVLATIVLSGLLANLLKIIFGRSRPLLFDKGGAWQWDLWSFGYANASFPSGHATTMGAVSALLCLWFPRMTVPVLAVGGLLALTRAAAQAHYLSDIVAGFCLGALFVIAAARCLAARQFLFRPGGTVHPTLARRG